MSEALDHFGVAALAKIGLAEIEAFAVKAYPKASAATRDRQAVTPVVAVLRHAAKRGMCAMPIIERPKKKKPAPRWISLQEADRLIENASDHMRPLIIFLIYTGARIGEALWLDWSNVDLVRRHVTFPETKNGEARGVTLHQRVVAALANLKHRDGEVFRRPDGKPYTRPKAKTGNPDDMDRSAGARIRTGFKGACGRAGIERFRVHDCRHTWATWHYAGNRDLGALQRLGGWKTLAMVMRYAHVNVEELQHTIDRLPAGGNLGEPQIGKAESA